MAQQPARFCSECGAPLQAGQRFCTNCGATMSADALAPTSSASPATMPAGDPTVAAPTALPGGGSDTPAPTQLSSMPTVPDGQQPSVPPPPPMGGSSPQRPGFSELTPPPPPPTVSTYNPYASGAPGGARTYPQNVSSPGHSPAPTPAPPGGTYTPVPVPAYAQKPKRGHGCLITSIVLLVVLAAGIGGFVFLRSRSGTTTQGNGTPTATSNTGHTPVSGNAGNTPTVSTSGLQQLNLKITYANVTLTIVSAQIASSFLDDNASPGPAGVLRVNLQENNATAGNPGYLESDVMLLLLPDGSTARSSNQKQDISPDAGVNRPNWVDFPLSSQVTVGQLTLRIGKSTENQMDVPLKPGADLSKYQDKISSPNAQFQYAGLNWTLKTATLSYSYNDRQATTGNLYVILNLSAVNNTSNGFIAGVTDYMRLQANGNSIQPEGQTTLPISIDAHTTASGIVAFLMPQGTTSFTLVMLARPNNNPPISQVTQNFQIQ
jgi:hypothetical protein